MSALQISRKSRFTAGAATTCVTCTYTLLRVIITPEVALSYSYFCGNITIFSLGCFQARKQVYFNRSLLNYRVKLLQVFCRYRRCNGAKKKPLMSRPDGFKVFKLKIRRHFWTLDIPRHFTLDPQQKPTLFHDRSLVKYVKKFTRRGIN